MNILFDRDYDPFMDLSYFADPVYKPKTILEIENGVNVFDDDVPMLFDDLDDVPMVYDATIVKEPVIFVVSVPVEKERSIFDDTSPLFKNKVYNDFLSNMRKKIATKLDILPASVVIQELPFSCSQVFSPVVVFDVSIQVLKEKSIFNSTSALFKNKSYDEFISKMRKNIDILPASLSVEPSLKNASIELVSFQFEKEKSIFSTTDGLFNNKVYNDIIANIKQVISTELNVKPASVIIQEEEVPVSCSKLFSPASVKALSVVKPASVVKPLSVVKPASIVKPASVKALSVVKPASIVKPAPSGFVNYFKNFFVKPAPVVKPASVVKVPTIIAPVEIVKEALEEDVLAEVRKKVKERRALKAKEEEEKTFLIVIEPVSQDDLNTIQSYTRNMLDDIMGQYDDIDIDILEEVISDVFEEVFEIEEEAVVIVPVKTKNPVGRPRKYPVPLETAIVNPVGRPRKVQSIALENAIVNPVGRPRKVQAVDVDAVKRPVGRPRKELIVPLPVAQIDIILPPEIAPIMDEMDGYVDEYDDDVENYLKLLAEANKPKEVIVPVITAKVVFEDEGDYEIKEQVNIFNRPNLKKAVVVAPVDDDAPPVFKAFLIYEDEDKPNEEEAIGDILAPPPPRFLVEEKQAMLYQVPYKIRNAKLNKFKANEAFVLEPVIQRSAFQLGQKNKARRGKVVSKDDMTKERVISSRVRYIDNAKRNFQGKREEKKGFQAFKKLQDDVMKKRESDRKERELAKGKIAYM